mgnify:CR=1 FL=1
MAKYTSCNHYVSALYRLATQKNLDAHRLLRNAGIAPELIDASRARVLTDKIATLVRQLWSELQDENMGLSLHPTKPGSFHMMGKLAVHAPTLEKALGRGVQFYQLVVDDYELQLTRSEHTAKITLKLKQPERDIENLLSELVMLAWHRFASWLIGQNIVLKEATFAYPTPSRIDEYKYLFPCLSHFNHAESSFSFSHRYLDLPVVQTHETLREFIADCPTNLFVLYRNDNSLSARVRQLIEPDVSRGIPGLDVVADKLGMTKYTIRQQLKAEGTSYQQIKNIVRRDMAIYYLTQMPSLSIAEIAPEVGFSEPGDFVRAFKGWTGVTPGHYRHSA